MKLPTCITTALLSAFLIFASAVSAPSEQSDNSFIISNVNIVDVEHRQILHNRRVYVKDGIIETIVSEQERDVKAPVDGIKHYDGDGGFLTPGLIDMHVHIYEPAAYLMTLSHGVTHVRVMNGVPKQLQWRDQIATGEMLGSTSTVSSPIISGDKDALLQHGVDTAEEAKYAVATYHKQGYDLIKAYGSLNQQTLSAIVQEAKARNMPVAKHGPHASGDMPLTELTGLQSFEHVEDIYQGPLNHQLNGDKLPAIAKQISTVKVPVTPTLNIFYQLTKLSNEKHHYLEQQPLKYTPSIIEFQAKRDQVKRWLTSSNQMAAHNLRTMEFLQQATKILNQHGVELLVGSDSGVLLSPHGIATHTEMQLMQESGLTSFDVLAAATVNAAKALKLDTQMGKVARSFNADFIFTKSNPIDDLTTLKHPAAVIKNGHWYSRQQLSAMRDKAIEERSLWQEFTTLLEAL
ncbi:amidohydrolase family protein [Thalassotalea ponticola]|uniref:amidohydrolase family protein n=1 Tax=Thalassotalea ponticola TaxID=1523392 RepID=UPI0025B544D6|nr:amidohydrolase family protein [Thalassotalea ponticola]MDN3652603.1 amidohydrolase family protein [Thalassotalea ponticola]